MVFFSWPLPSTVAKAVPFGLCLLEEPTAPWMRAQGQC